MAPRQLVPPLAVACLLALLVTVTLHIASRDGAEPDRVPDPSSASGDGGQSPERPGRAAAVTTARRILADWDRARSAAWARGSVVQLRRLYVPQSSAGAQDVRLLQRYRARGIRVRGLRTQVLSLRVESNTAGALVVQVTDRITGAVAVTGRGHRRALPRDAPSIRTIEFRRHDGRWLVSAVGAVG